MSYENDPPIDTEIGFAVAEALNEVLSFLVEHPELLPFLATLAAATAGEALPITYDKAETAFFAAARQDFIDAGNGALGFGRWARANLDDLQQLKRILFSI